MNVDSPPLNCADCRLCGALGTVDGTRNYVFWDSDVQILLTCTNARTQSHNTAYLEFTQKLGGGSSKAGIDMLQGHLLPYVQNLSPGDHRLEESTIKSLLKWPSNDSINLSDMIAVYRPNAGDDAVCCIQHDVAPSGEPRSVSQIYNLLLQSLQSKEPAQLVAEVVQSVAQQEVNTCAQHSPVQPVAQQPGGSLLQPVAQQPVKYSNSPAQTTAKQADLMRIWKNSTGHATLSNSSLMGSTSSSAPGALFHLKSP